MRYLRSFLFLAIFLLFTTVFIIADVLKVRVTASMANIRLKPSIQSEIISKIPLGTMLEVIKKEGNWYFVKLPPDEKGIVVAGYIHQSIVEAIEEIKKPVDSKEEETKEEKSPEIEKLPEAKEEKPQKEIPQKVTKIRIKETQKEGKEQRGFSVASRLGIGLFSSLVNFGLGPSLEYWATENLGVMGSIGAGGNFTSYTIRGNFLFSNDLFIAKLPMRPFLGIGFTKIEGPEETWLPPVEGGDTLKTETEGNGIQIFAGLIHQAAFLHDNIFFRWEFSYTTFDVKGSFEYTVYGFETIKESVTADFHAFSLSFGISYFF